MKWVGFIALLSAAYFAYRQGFLEMGYNKTVEAIAYENARNTLIRREGYRNIVYKDTEGYLTVGIGHKVLSTDGLKLGDKISDEKVESLFKKDMDTAFAAALSQARDLGRYTPEFIAALTSVNFQLGTNWPAVFYNTYPLLKGGNWREAINNLNMSKWAAQTPVRVADFTNAIRTEFSA